MSAPPDGGDLIRVTTLAGASRDSRKGSDGWDGTPGMYTHVGYGVTVSTREFPRIAAEITKQFPDVKQPNLFKTESAGQECVIFDPDQVIEHVYFPESGMVSMLAVLLDGSGVETASTGRDGMVGMPVFHGTDRIAQQLAAVAPALAPDHCPGQEFLICRCSSI